MKGATHKLGMSLETQGNKTFGRDIPGFLPGRPGVPEKLRKNDFRKVQIKWGLKATLCNLRAIVYNCPLLWPF